MNITYLFGAGASAKALPVVKDLPTRMKSFINNLKDHILDDIPFNDLPFRHTPKQLQQEFINHAENLLLKVQEHSSIDTYAKKLLITNRVEEYQILKAILSSFFIYEQHNNKVDDRYDSFFASLIDSSGILPRNLRILSWNYDYQFEKAYAEYSENYSLSDNQRRLNVHHSRCYNVFYDSFSIFKINGTTSYYSKSKSDVYNLKNDFKEFEMLDFIEKTVWLYGASKAQSNILVHLLSFAWEMNDSEIVQQFHNGVVAAVKKTDVLIVIAYSFPFFNRSVDKGILTGMENLKKVYIQDLNADTVAEAITSVLNLNNKPEIIKRYNCVQFYLPPEM